MVPLDLTHPGGGWDTALGGVDCLVLTANAVAARAGDRPAEVDDGLARLMRQALEAGVRVVLPSVPLRGEPYATIGRESPFLRRFRAFSGTLVEDRGLMLVPGRPGNRNAFISVRDAARACVVAATSAGEAPAPVDVAGPEVLSWHDVAELYSRVLHRRVRILSTPEQVYAAVAGALRPVAEVPSRTMALNRYLAASQTPWTTVGGGLLEPEGMLTAATFLETKAALPAALPSVP